MLYSAYEPPTRRWLVYSSRRNKPRVTVSSRWESAPFVHWDELEVHLPTDAHFVETSGEVRGMIVRYFDIIQPLSQRNVDYLAIGGTIAAILWALIKPFFTKETP
ncbi:hypothetical protein L6R29_23095 [Myxococcota bacterium]|nr:hypothetical protein [Myxococcota bacterium]